MIASRLAESATLSVRWNQRQPSAILRGQIAPPRLDTTWISIASRLFGDMHPTAARIIFPQKKTETKHDRCSHGKNHEGVDICQGRRLRQQGLINPRIGGCLGLMSSQSRVREMLGQAMCRVR